MAVKRDYYEVLSVGRDASEADLKRAFRQAALQNHPDRNQGDPAAAARFKECSEAYEILSDPDKRRSYDMFGHAGVEAGQGFDGGFGDLGFGDIFNTFFGAAAGGRQQRRTARGQDLRYDLTIDFEEAFEGVEREIEVPRQTTCAVCSGSGAEPGTRAETCGTCSGSGQVRRQAQSIFGTVVNVTACPTCGGEGRVLRSPCHECRGQGRVETRHKLRVRIPRGVDTGSQIRLGGEGAAGFRAGSPGDLYIVLRVRPHPQLKRQDDDVFCELPINFVQAALGDRIEVPTLDGEVEVSVPAGTQHGQAFRLPGRGMPNVRNGRRGDQLVVVQLVVPKDFSPEQRSLLRKVGGLTGKPQKVQKGFFEKLRDAINID
ncbi:MAG: molecular chaperone DnaJ [Candidatus Dormibacteraeota bacterium]|nr:molecular chaperone DnaJ [Candidatus Dormibacteraeota bacterium]